VNKKLDVRVRGTQRTLWRNGKYENQIGFTVLTNVLSNVDQKIFIKLGYNETRLSFPLKNLHPLTTTERPKFVSEAEANPVVYCKNYRVVVIGGDLTSNNALVGNYGKVVASEMPGCARVVISSPGPYAHHEFIFREEALCGSYHRTIEWDGLLIA
jgi:hypothetical protein